MPKRKGLCLEEKRVRLLQIFHEKKDFFQLKELEKIAPKEKGIIAQSVKDVLQSLVDDGMVDTDKIGSSVYFWAYPSQAHNLKKKKLDEFENKLEHLQLKLNDARKALAEAKQNRKDNAERQNALAKIEKLNEIKNELESKLKTYKDCDPSFIQKLKADTMKAKYAANKWTDNIYAVKTWCKNNFMIEGDVINQQFGIPTDLEYFD